jgi:hypothetical protein
VHLGKLFSQQPMERQLENWALLGLDLAPGRITGGLKRLEPLFTPVYEALLARGAQAGVAQADDWMPRAATRYPKATSSPPTVVRPPPRLRPFFLRCWR